MAATPPIITVMSRAAEKAARSLLRDFNEVEKLQVSVKGPGDFVSAADRRAEEIIHEELSKSRSDWGYLMEESGEKAGKINSRFIVDPLDGTTNFLHGIPHWCISIAAEENGVITAGVVFNPVQDELFYAAKGIGAWMRGNKRLRVSGRKDMGMSVIATNDSSSYQDRLAKVEKQAASVRSFGATALDLAYVASGRFDAYYGGRPNHGPKPWDNAAGSIIVREAGGYVTEIDGRNDPVYNQNILAGNEHIYQTLKEILNSK
jgi:myo-inositol-1(or 4)-monophosphatase